MCMRMYIYIYMYVYVSELLNVVCLHYLWYLFYSDDLELLWWWRCNWYSPSITGYSCLMAGINYHGQLVVCVCNWYQHGNTLQKPSNMTATFLTYYHRSGKPQPNWRTTAGSMFYHISSDLSVTCSPKIVYQTIPTYQEEAGTCLFPGGKTMDFWFPEALQGPGVQPHVSWGFGENVNG